jgi:hypothetical protein
LDVKNYHGEFAKYCQGLGKLEHELRSVESSFYGDYRSAIEFASKDYKSPSSVIVANGNGMELTREMEQILGDESKSIDERKNAKEILELLNRGKNLEALFKNLELKNAEPFIVATAKNFHFLLLNEAHYSTQNRIFTESLLRPLWDVGYRYLALETLSPNDSLLQERGYPTIETGYYTRDPAFSNMIRKALDLGYKVIPYETERKVDGTPRDSDQARNIFTRSYLTDRIGKVIVHAGYSHISEDGSEMYRPMGQQLKELYGHDILTIDQQTMTELNGSLKENLYYTFAEETYHFKEPVVFLFNEEVFVDPINRGGVDIQIFHPRTVFHNNRPNWLLRDNFKSYAIPNEIRKYSGHLLQAFTKGEPLNAMPIDQVIISDGNSFILPGGEYIVRIIDCMGTLRYECEMSVPK